VVDKIALVERDMTTNRPKVDVKIISVTLVK